jgi:hypothetical protein
VLFGFMPWLNWRTSWFSFGTSSLASNSYIEDQLASYIRKCFHLLLFAMHRFHHLLLADPSHGLEHWFFFPLRKPQSHCNNFHCIVLANGVCPVLLMSNPSTKCYS